jgi:Na+-transporting methylmalonyl-CoA/oxaloacetate decarboxylase gamma subunit
MTENLQKAFELLALGWGGVFVVLIIIYLASMALAKFFPAKKKEA